MQKSLYDQSALTWSPQGRLYQVEYAMEAVNQGNLLLGQKDPPGHNPHTLSR